MSNLEVGKFKNKKYREYTLLILFQKEIEVPQTFFSQNDYFLRKKIKTQLFLKNPCVLKLKLPLLDEKLTDLKKNKVHYTRETLPMLTY